MSRTSSLSSTFVEAVNAAETDEAFLVLVTIDDADLSDPIRVTSDSVKTEKSSSEGGDVYQPFPFEVELPDDTDDMGGALARLRMDAVDRRVVEAVRRVSGVPEVTLEVVLASDPDTVEVSWPTFSLSNARYGDQAIEADLTLEVLDQEPFPGPAFNPALFPGLY